MPTATLPDATCVRFEPEIWFDKFTQKLALELCGSCPAVVPCLAVANKVEAGEPYVFGVRGGLTAAARVRTRRDRIVIMAAA